MSEQPSKPHQPFHVGRRDLFVGGGAAALGGVGGWAARQATFESDDPTAHDASLTYPFKGEHQQGVSTPMQEQLSFVALDLIVDNREDLIQLLSDWTLAAERMTLGEPAASFTADKDITQGDTGEALDLAPNGLTITFGFGKTMFVTEEGEDRFGIADHLPPALEAGIPATAGEFFADYKLNGDVCIQACANDPQVAIHATRNLTRLAFGRATVRWAELGFGRASSTSKEQVTPRNLFGFKDGTDNIKPDDEPDVATEFLWVADEDEGGNWASGGTYLAFRKFRMLIEMWDDLTLESQEDTFGRDKVEGAPLSGGTEFTAMDFDAKDAEGMPEVPADSHVALVHPDNNDGQKMNRRSYNYTYGVDELGRLDSGLHFIAFVRDPQQGFNAILQKMARNDLMMEYLRQERSGLFLCPPGLGESESYIGQRLFEAN